MFNDNYIIESKGFPLVTYYKELKNLTSPYIFTPMHYHSDFEILYIVHGKAKMQIGGNLIYASDNSMLLINPYETHYGETMSDDFSYYCIDFNISMLSLPHEEKLLNEEVKYENHFHERAFKQYIKSIFNAFDKEPSGWRLLATGSLFTLFSFLDDKVISYLPSRENEFTKSIINYLSENYAKNITSKTISAELNYNQSYFCRMFKKFFGMRFNDYVNIYRIKIAKELLKSENVSNTAALCGFSNISYFSVTFKNVTAMTPMEYKKALKSINLF